MSDFVIQQRNPLGSRREGAAGSGGRALLKTDRSVVIMADWIKSRETELATQSTEFAANIAAGPPTVFGLTAGDSTTLNTYTTDYNTKLNVALNPDTRTPVAVAE